MSESDQWREEMERKIRRKLGMSDDDPTNRPDYWKEWEKISRKREAQKAESIEYAITDDELANYPSYGWPLKCAWCGFGITRVNTQDCDGIVFLCSECGRPNIVRRNGNTITISPGARVNWPLIISIFVVVAIMLWMLLK